MTPKKKKAAGLVGLFVIAGAVVAFGAAALGFKLPEATPDPGQFDPIGGLIVGQGFDPDADVWYFYIADCGEGPFTADNIGDYNDPANFLPQCGPDNLVPVSPKTWQSYGLADKYLGPRD